VRCAELSRARHRSRFAVAETAGSSLRVLCLTDDKDAATEVAAELRRRGVRAVAYRTGL
jgi:hypothetical protein